MFFYPFPPFEIFDGTTVIEAMVKAIKSVEKSKKSKGG